MIIIIKFNRRLKKKILITGGLGFIGSHTSLKLLDNNYEIIILDNLSNSKIKVIKRIKELAKKDFKFIKGDIRDRRLLRKLFKNNLVDSVIHFAGLKAAGESEKYPLDYYDNNVIGSMVLLQEMKKANVKSIIFSSSASVYGNAPTVKCTEETQLNPISVYGKTKLIIEDMLKNIYKSSPEWKIINLRYFSPIGAHSTGIIGEDYRNKPTNLIPFITDVALGKKDQLLVFGDDYNTNDGTGKRDYIHIEDLARGHLFALEKLSKESNICRDIDARFIHVSTDEVFCSLGPRGKFDSVPHRKYVERLEKRNNFLIASHHPLRETLIRQTGESYLKRHQFLQDCLNTARKYQPSVWQSEEEGEPSF